MTRSPYKRRRPALLLRLWVYRWMVLLAMILGVILWFIVINNTPVVVYFPFGIGEIRTRSGVAILLGAFGGAIATALALGIVWAWHRARTQGEEYRKPVEAKSSAIADDRPPPDYAARTKEGFSGTPGLPGS